MWLVAGTPDLAGPIDGANSTFTPKLVLRDDAIVYLNGVSRLPGPATGNGYVYDGHSVTMGEPPVPGDVLAIWQQDTEVTFAGGPTPGAGMVATLSPSIDIEIETPLTTGLPPPTGSASTN